MSDDATPRLSLPYLAASQAQKHVTLNEALALLDGLVACAFESRTVSVQPASPADGALHLLPPGASGAAWSGFAAGAAVRFEAGAWSLLPAPLGALAYLRDEGLLLVRASGGWADVGLALRQLANLDRLGVGTTADAANPLAVKAAGVLFDHAGAGVQVRLNKATSADVGSLLFQTGYGGRAEIGLVGDDALHLRTSPDGSAWTDALVVAGGRVGVGTSAPTSRLHVDGPVRVGGFAKADLPAAAAVGAGAIVFVSDATGGATLAVSDGSVWRRAGDLSPV